MADIRVPDYLILQSAIEPPQAIDYGVRMIGAELEWPEVRDKLKEIKVAFMDTGAPQHPDVKLAGMFDVSGSGPYDRRGHGTHVAGILAADGWIKGVAPGVSLYSVKVFGDSGPTGPGMLTAGLKKCREFGMDIISISIGGPGDIGYEFQEELKACHQAGIVVIASAGNYGLDYGVLYPAKYKEVIAVAAVDLEKNQGDFSAWGNELDVAAAGVNVWSTWLGGKYTQLSGTSMACPHIAGAAAILQAKALIREGKKDPPDVVRLMLRRYAEDLGDSGPDIRYGCGTFSFGRFIGPDRPQREVKVEVGISDGSRVYVPVEMGTKRYWIDGTAAEFDVPCIRWNGRTMVEARGMADAFGLSEIRYEPPYAVFKG